MVTRAFVSGHYHRGQYVAHDSKGKVVHMRPTVRPPEKRVEIVIEPWIRKALDGQRRSR